jgi:energy-coupling factor transporter ATP-binding protein EcfA2
MRAADNPFRAERMDGLDYRPQGISWEEILCRLHELELRAAIVGPHGSGKSTLLNDLGNRFERQGFQVRSLFMNSDSLRPSLTALAQVCRHSGPGTLILFDGACHLPWPAWQSFKFLSRRAGGLIITAHSPGRMPLLVKTSTTTRLLETIVADLYPDPPSMIRQQLPALHQKHKGNIRQALFELYRISASC